MTDFDTRAWLDDQPEVRRRIWSSIEWGLWGSGLGDVLREPVAATMVDALSDEQVTEVHATMTAWQEHKAKQGSHPGWEELAKAKAEVERLRALLNDSRAILDTVSRTEVVQTADEDLAAEADKLSQRITEAVS